MEREISVDSLFLPVEYFALVENNAPEESGVFGPAGYDGFKA